MSWSRSFTGTPAEIDAAARDAIPAIEATLPDFEKPQVKLVVVTAGMLLATLEPQAQVTASLNGHGYQNSEGATGGGMGISLSWKNNA